MMVVVATTIIVVKYAKLLDRYGYSRHEPNLSDVVSANRIRRCPYMAGKTQTDVGYIGIILSVRQQFHVEM